MQRRGFQYTDPQPAQTTEEKNAQYWKEQSKARGERNVAKGKEALAKNGPVPTLDSLYAASTKEAEERHAQRLQEAAQSPYALEKRIPTSMLPPNDPIRREYFNEKFGKPTHKAEVDALKAEIEELKEQATIATLSAQIAELERKLQ